MTFQIGLYLDGYATGVTATNNCFANLARGVFFQNASWAPANGNSVTSAHMQSVVDPDVKAAFGVESPATLGNTFAYDADWSTCPSVIAAAGPSAAVLARWSLLLAGPVYPPGWFTCFVGRGVGYSDGANYCNYAGWVDFVNGTGLNSAETFPVYPEGPSGQTYTGACPGTPVVDPAAPHP